MICVIEVKQNYYGENPGKIDAYIRCNGFLDALNELSILRELNGNDYTFRLVEQPYHPVTVAPHGVGTECASCPHSPKPGTVWEFPASGNPYHYC